MHSAFRIQNHFSAINQRVTVFRRLHPCCESPCIENINEWQYQAACMQDGLVGRVPRGLYGYLCFCF